MSKNLKLTALILSAVMAVSCIPANIFAGNLEVLKISDTEVRPLEDFTEELQQYPEYYISGSLTKTTDRSYSYDSAGRLTDTENVSTIEGTITKLKDQYGNVVQNLNQELDPTLYKFTEGAYTYNGEGQRVKKEVIMYDENGDALPTVTRKYYYTGDCVLFVADASNNKTIENVHDPSGNILLSQRFELTSNGNFENGWYLFNTDIRGSVTSILREDLTFATGYVYDEYGNQIKTGEKDFLNEATYTGAIYDEESDLYFLNARYYDSNTGQFISRDTYLGDAYSPWTQNLYSYTGGNPVNYIDPTGHIAITATLAAAAIAAAAPYVLAALAAVGTAYLINKIISMPRRGPTVFTTPRREISIGVEGIPVLQRSAGDYVESFPWGADIGYGGTIVDPIPTAQELSDYVERFPWAEVVMPRVLLDTTVIGKAHGSEIHQQRINDIADGLIASGKYAEVYMNRALKTAGLNGTYRPDIIAKGLDGIYTIWEIASKSQAEGTRGNRELREKMEKMGKMNPSAIMEDLVPW